MSNVITLRVPESLYARAKKLAKDDGISLNQYVQMALTEKLARQEAMVLVEKQFQKLEDDLRKQMAAREHNLQEWLQEEHNSLKGWHSYLTKLYSRGGS